MGYPRLAHRVVEEGKADFVALGRPLLADPEWSKKAREGRLEDIRPCIGCLEGCRRRIHDGKTLSCTVNPTTGKEKELAIRPAPRKKTVLVIGGGPGGMEAARVAALQGHKVILWEKNDALGGNLLPASGPDFKEDYRTLVGYLSTQLKKLGVNVELRKEGTSGSVVNMKPDVVFVATGSTPLVPDIPGLEKKNVVTAHEVLLGKKEPGQRVVIIGGGIVGCEVALYLGQKGKKVTIIEILDGLARDMYFVNRVHLLKLLADANVKVLTNTRVLEVTDSVTVADKDGKKEALQADTVILAIGLKSNSELYDALLGKVPELYAMGDCSKPRKVINAIWEGHRLARLV